MLVGGKSIPPFFFACVIMRQMRLKLYSEILADVRRNGLCPIKSLVQPDYPEVREVAQVLSQAEDPIAAAQEFIDDFTDYLHEEGDYWSTPRETFERGAGDCDCKAIALCSILRNWLPADQVFCAFGNLSNGSNTGHMWLILEGEGGEDRIIESTAPPGKPLRSGYKLLAIFNDKYAFSSPEGIREFDLVIKEQEALWQEKDKSLISSGTSTTQ